MADSNIPARRDRINLLVGFVSRLMDRDYRNRRFEGKSCDPTG